MAEAKFIYDGQDIFIQCNKNQKMKDICTNICNKINVELISLVFLYRASRLNSEKAFNEITKENKINILVDKYDNEEICSKCGRILNNEIINEIISSNNNIYSSLSGIKGQIDLLINNQVDINYINNQLKNIKMYL